MNKEEAIMDRCLEEGCLRTENTASVQPKEMNEFSMSEGGNTRMVKQSKRGGELGIHKTGKLRSRVFIVDSNSKGRRRCFE